MKHLLVLMSIVLINFSVIAQSSTDVIYKSNGEEMKGKIVKVTDEEVSFIYAGETAEYVIKKADISKIVHSSGRTEVMNSPAATTQQVRKKDDINMTASSVDHHNKIAILPFTFLMDNQPGAEAIGYKAQDDAYAYLSKHTAGYTILDNRTTNALLAKAGVTRDKMMNFTMQELGNILGAEYIVDGTVTQNKGYATSSSTGNDNLKVKRDGDKDVKGISNQSSTYSNSVQRYDVAVSIHIYMDNNASIYNESHKAFLTNTDGSYSGPLEYVLKRSPIYRK